MSLAAPCQLFSCSAATDDQPTRFHLQSESFLCEFPPTQLCSWSLSEGPAVPLIHDKISHVCFISWWWKHCAALILPLEDLITAVSQCDVGRKQLLLLAGWNHELIIKRMQKEIHFFNSVTEQLLSQLSLSVNSTTALQTKTAVITDKLKQRFEEHRAIYSVVCQNMMPVWTDRAFPSVCVDVTRSCMRLISFIRRLSGRSCSSSPSVWQQRVPFCLRYQPGCCWLSVCDNGLTRRANELTAAVTLLCCVHVCVLDLCVQKQTGLKAGLPARHPVRNDSWRICYRNILL